MLRKKILLTAAIVALSAFAFTACEGPTGAQGPQGPSGEHLLRVTSNLDIFSTNNIGAGGDYVGITPPGVEIAVVGTTLLYNALEYIPFDASRTFVPRFYLENTGLQTANLTLAISAPALNAFRFQIPAVAGDWVTPPIPMPEFHVVTPGAAIPISITLPAGGARRAVDVLPGDPLYDDTLDWFGVAAPYVEGEVSLTYVLPYGGSVTRTHVIHFIRPRRFVDPPLIAATPAAPGPAMPAPLPHGASIPATNLVALTSVAPMGDPARPLQVARLHWNPPLNATGWDVQVNIPGMPAAELPRAGRFDAFIIERVRADDPAVVPQTGWTPITAGLGYAWLNNLYDDIVGGGVVTRFDGLTVSSVNMPGQRPTPLGVGLGVDIVNADDAFPQGSGHYFLRVIARGVSHIVAGGAVSVHNNQRQLTGNSGPSNVIGLTVTEALNAPVISLSGSVVSWAPVTDAVTYRIYRGAIDGEARAIGDRWLLATIGAAAQTNGTFSIDLTGGPQDGITWATAAPLIGGVRAHGAGTLNIGDNTITVMAIPAVDQPFAVLGNPDNHSRASILSDEVIYRFRVVE